MPGDKASLLERAAFWLSTKRVQECVDSLRRGDDWETRPEGDMHRTKPYPMGFHPDARNLYYAVGWGRHELMLPHERWLVRRAALRAPCRPARRCSGDDCASARRIADNPNQRNERRYGRA